MRSRRRLTFVHTYVHARCRMNPGQGDDGTSGEADEDDRLLPGKKAKEVTSAGHNNIPV